MIETIWTSRNGGHQRKKVVILLLTTATFSIASLSNYTSPLPLDQAIEKGELDPADERGELPATTPPPPLWKVLYHEQTVALVEFRGTNLTLADCELILAEQNDKMSKNELLAHLSKRFTTEPVDFLTMVSIVENCKTLQDGPTHVIGSDNKLEKEDDNEYLKVMRGILPGTLWCGFDDVAPNYKSLGPQWKLDRCCRAHDHCPVKVKGFQHRYGVFNVHPYTKTHCYCDEKFYNCLKEVGEEKADAVGNLFFNIIQTQCIQEEHTCEVWSKNSDNTADKDGRTSAKRRCLKYKSGTNFVQKVAKRKY